MDEMREESDTNTPYINSPMPERLRRFAGQIKEKYDSEEFQAFWQPVLHDDEGGVYAWAETRLGRKPDFVIKASYLGRKELGDATPRETWALVDDRGEKLAGEAKGEPDDEGIAVFLKKTKKYPSLEHALSEYADWILEIDRAIRITGAESPYGYPLTLSAVEYRIVRDDPRRGGITNLPGEDSSIVKNLRSQVKAAEARATKGDLGLQEHAEAMRAWWRAEEELKRVRGLANTASLESLPPLPEDKSAREKFLEKENRRVELMVWERYAGERNEAGLSPREREVFRLALHLENKEIAEVVGGTGKQIYQEKLRAVGKVREAVGGL